TTFEDLVRDDIEEVMLSAFALVEKRLQGERSLDRVILTGQASRAPLVRRVLLETFAQKKLGGSEIEWHPSGVLIEQEFGKQSTSLGACWAEMVRRAQTSPEGAKDRLRKGHNALRVDVDNLFFNLPCSLRRSETLGGSGEDGTEILPMGAELEQLDPA